MTFKKILSLVLACCMIFAVLSLTSCGDKSGNENKNDDENNNPAGNGGGEGTEKEGKTYTVTVVDGEGNLIEGVKLVITDEKTYPTATTGENGKASVSLPEGNVSVMVTSVPDGYLKPEKVSGIYHAVFTNGKAELTITLEKEASNTVTYTVKVVDQNGDAVVGIDVQICYDGICAAAVATNEDGEIKSELAPNTVVDVKLYNLEGYTLPDPVNGDYHAVISEGETEVTVQITKN